MSDIRYAVVPAGGAEVTTLSLNGSVYVPMRLFVEALGIDWPNEYRRINRDPIMSKAVVKLTTAFSAGQEQLCLPLELFHGWLFKLNLNTINERARPVVEALQVEGYQVLHDYWVHGSATNPRAIAQMELTDRTARRRELPRLMERMKRETNPAVRRVLHALIAKACDSEGIAAPGIDEIGQDAPGVDELLAPFWDGVGRLREAGRLINHSRIAGRLALNLPEVAAAFAESGIGVPVDRGLRSALRESTVPQFLMDGAVNSVVRRKSVNCFVFNRAC